MNGQGSDSEVNGISHTFIVIGLTQTQIRILIFDT